MSVSPLREWPRQMPVEARLASRKAEADVLFDLIGCLDSAPAEWVIPWFKAIGRFLAQTGLSWRDIAFILREHSRKTLQSDPEIS